MIDDILLVAFLHPFGPLTKPASMTGLLSSFRVIFAFEVQSEFEGDFKNSLQLAGKLLLAA